MLVSDVDLTDDGYLDSIRQSFPAVMNQQDDSTNQKLLNIFGGVENYYKNQLLALNDLNILENVSGDMLTQLALDWNIRRIDNDDEFLRFQIRFAMWKRHLGVGINDIKEFIAFIMNIQPSDFNINSTGIEDISVTEIPFNFSENDHADVKSRLLVQAIESVLPTEWKLTDVQYLKQDNSQFYFAIWTQKAMTKRTAQEPFNYSVLSTAQLYRNFGFDAQSYRIKNIDQDTYNYDKNTTNLRYGVNHIAGGSVIFRKTDQ